MECSHARIFFVWRECTGVTLVHIHPVYWSSHIGARHTKLHRWNDVTLLILQSRMAYLQEHLHLDVDPTGPGTESWNGTDSSTRRLWEEKVKPHCATGGNEEKKRCLLQ